ncbi:MAG: dTDP-4-dehydrorhamnose reductase [Elusimicrobia bacterium]|nr:dTDP-4-dehydrorhamnose reductase [Elusimicrobiota bacterium]
MKILVTGSSGQLARALQTEMPHRSTLSGVFTSHSELDITHSVQIEKIMNQHQPDLVINTAAYNLVDQAEEEPQQAYLGNKTGPELLAKWTSKAGIPLIHFSTDYVFDGTSSNPYTESSPTAPLSVYGKSKWEGEQAVFQENSRAIVVRTSWVFNVKGRNLALRLLALGDNVEIKVVSDQWGCPTYAPHLAKKILDMVENKSGPGLYHLAGGGRTTWFEFIRYFFQMMDVKKKVHPVLSADFPRKAARPRFSVLKTEKGAFFELPPWEQGVTEFVKELKHGM